MIKLKIITFFLLIFLLNSCGFKVIDQSELYNFQVEEIDTSGDKYISYKLHDYVLNLHIFSVDVFICNWAYVYAGYYLRPLSKSILLLFN